MPISTSFNGYSNLEIFARESLEDRNTGDYPVTNYNNN